MAKGRVLSVLARSGDGEAAVEGEAKAGDDRDAAYWLRVWESGAKFHMFGSLALLAAPLTRRPNAFGVLMTAGTALFSGSCYVQTLTVGEMGGFPWAPLGGGVVVLGWLALL